MVLLTIGILTGLLLSPLNAAGYGYHEPFKAEGASSSSGFEFFMPPSDPAASRPSVHMPITLNRSIEWYVRQFRSEKTGFQRGLNNAAPYLPFMKEVFRDEGLPEELLSIVMIESRFDHAAVSSAQAVGPWQFMARTAGEYALTSDAWVDERRDPIKSTLAAARYLRSLHERLGSWPLAIAAYNAGVSKVRRAIAGTGSHDFWTLKETHYLDQETRRFVPKVMAASVISGDPAQYGFTVPVAMPLRFDVVVLDRSVDVAAVAAMIGTTGRMLRSLNPELKGRHTPPRTYALRIPVGTRAAFMARAGSILSRTSPGESQGEGTLSVTAAGDSRSRKHSSPNQTAAITAPRRYDLPEGRNNADSVLVRMGRQRKIRAEKPEKTETRNRRVQDDIAGTSG